METDWEVEVGGGAPVIEALWPGFIDLRCSPELLGEIAEAAVFPALADLLLALNGPASPLWTAKCDLWEPDPAELAIPELTSLAAVSNTGVQPAAVACYVDLLPVEGRVFAQWPQAEQFCREWIARLGPLPLSNCRVDLIVRQALAGEVEGFGVTAYLSGMGKDRSTAAKALSVALAAFAGSIPASAAPITAAAKLQWKSVGE
jgi:hypothetical protein